MTNPSAGVDLQEFLPAYLAEMGEQLAAANGRLLEIEASTAGGQTNPRAVRDLFRALHTMKGLSAMVGVEPVVALAHHMESVLRASDQGGGKLPAGAVDNLLEGIGEIAKRVREVSSGKEVTEPPAALLEALDRLDPVEERSPLPVATLELEPELAAKLAAFELDLLVAGAVSGRRALRMSFVPSAERAAAGLTVTAMRERLGTVADVIKVVPLTSVSAETGLGVLRFVLLFVTASSDEDIAAAVGLDAGVIEALKVVPVVASASSSVPLPAVDGDESDSAPQRRGFVRVDVVRLDDAMEQLSALIVTRSRLSRAVAELKAAGVGVRELSEIVKDNARQLRDLRAAILRVRMVPIIDVLDRVPLIVRGLRRESGKLVRLVVDVGNAELDKAVGERVFPAIVHLVRNAVDHAIELPAERRAAGKPEEGTLSISCAAHSNTRLELTISDDGKGVDRAHVALLTAGPFAETDAALLEAMCRAGLTTRAEASTTSGRGMGMDIVKRIVVDELGGELFMKTEPGRGTTFTLRIPLTIAIVDAFVVECAGQRFVVPVSMVEEILEIDPATTQLAPHPAAAHGSAALAIVQRRSETVPLLDLATVLELPVVSERPRQALVVRRGGEPVAFAVHRVLGQQEAVVRPLVDPLVQVSGISGATDLGNGKPTLVLDLGALVATHGVARRERAA